MSSKLIKKNLEQGRDLGHVTLTKFGVPSNVSQK